MLPRLIRKAVTFACYDPYLILMKLGLATETAGGGNPFVRWRTQRKIRQYGLEEFYRELAATDEVQEYQLFVSWHKRHDNLNLFELILDSRPRTILEFGAGTSTIIMAYALKRLGRGGKVHSVESDARWAEVVRGKLKVLGLAEFAEVSAATARAEEFEGQIVTSFDSLPDVRPDLIYVDGPDPKSVEGDVKGLTADGMHFMVLKDVLLYEWALYAGARIVLDGRLHNFRFLKANLKRKYRFRRRYSRNINEILLVR